MSVPRVFHIARGFEVLRRRNGTVFHAFSMTFASRRNARWISTRTE
jgi:hypothetical protein